MNVLHKDFGKQSLFSHRTGLIQVMDILVFRIPLAGRQPCHIGQLLYAPRLRNDGPERSTVFFHRINKALHFIHFYVRIQTVSEIGNVFS